MAHESIPVSSARRVKTLHAALPSHSGGGTEKEERASGVANTKKRQQGGDIVSCATHPVMHMEGTEGGSPRPHL